MPKKSITLIELMVVIVILGILTAIAIPNVKNHKEQASLNGATTNKIEVQKGIDRYFMEKQEFPTLIQPTVGHPQNIDWTKLEPPYLIQKPQDLDRFYYWVDSFGTIWMSDIDSPTGLGIVGTTVTFNENSDATSYQVGYIENDAFRSISNINAGGKGYNWSKKGQKGDGNFAVSNGKVTVDIPDDLTGRTLVANVVSKRGLETAPISVGYIGGILEVPTGEKPTAVITMTPNSSIDTATTIAWSSANSTDPKGRAIVQEEWQNKQDTYGIGNQTVKLRVKNDKGYWSDWVQITFNVALGNQKPTAVINLTPNANISTATSVAWSYGSSTDPDGDSIINAEWQLDSNPVTSTPDGIISTAGVHAMKLRVQDSNGTWSDWVSMNITVVDTAYNIVSTGQYVKFGKYNGYDITWRIVKKDATNGIMLFATAPLKTAGGAYEMRAFDAVKNAGEPDDGSAARQNFGSNNWEKSDVRNYLNSTVYNGFTNKSIIKQVSHYSALDFLDRSEATIGSTYHILDTGATTALQNYNTTAYRKTISDYVYLLNTDEVINIVKPVMPTQYYSASETYWLRDSSHGGGSVQPQLVRIISAGGTVGNTCAKYITNFYVRPALNINQSATILSGTGTSGDPYIFQ